MLAEIKNVFRPEFLNRIDEITVFDSLHYDELVEIIKNMLRDLRAKLAENGLTLEVSQEARELFGKRRQRYALWRKAFAPCRTQDAGGPRKRFVPGGYV